eukprot:280332-Pelagomonas_calceolata.AAC.1
MTRVPCPRVPGYAFGVDESAQPEETSAKLDYLGTNCPVMTFQGLASGAPASILIDSGASRCFVDSTFAMHHGFARHPTKTSVKLADGTSASASMLTNVRVKFQGHISGISCFVLDMQQQYDVILGETWLQKTNAFLDYETKSCIVGNSQKQVLPVRPQLANRVSDSGIVSETSEKPSPVVQKLLDGYQDVFKPRDSLPPVQNIGHTIPLEPGHEPPFRLIFRLSPLEPAEVGKQVKELLKHGFIEPSSSPYGAPVLFVAKKD